MQETNRPEPAGLTKTDRLIALTDGLFATVLTILVLQIGAPGINSSWTAAQFFNYLTQLSSTSLLSYVLTFLVAGLYWQAHHRLFDFILHTDQRLIWFNLMFLLCVGLLPFSTNLVGAHLDQISWSAYCINMVLIGLMFIWEGTYAVTHGFFVANDQPHLATHYLWRSVVTPGIFLASLVVTQIDFRVAIFFPLLIFVVRAIVDRIFPADEQTGLQPVPGQRKPNREILWGIALFFPLILFAYWLIWISNYYHAPK
jgi:uncharacterized membrane protein